MDYEPHRLIDKMMSTRTLLEVAHTCELAGDMVKRNQHLRDARDRLMPVLSEIRALLEDETPLTADDLDNAVLDLVHAYRDRAKARYYSAIFVAALGVEKGADVKFLAWDEPSRERMVGVVSQHLMRGLPVG